MEFVISLYFFQNSLDFISEGLIRITVSIFVSCKSSSSLDNLAWFDVIITECTLDSR